MESQQQQQSTTNMTVIISDRRYIFTLHNMYYTILFDISILLY